MFLKRITTQVLNNYLITFQKVSISSNFTMPNNENAQVKPTFRYFGYGSNLLAKRIQIQNPTAVRVGPGLLKNFRLDFGYMLSGRWNGAPATIVEDEGNQVWGAVWDIDQDQLANLDEQEGVHTGIYRALEVTIETPNNETFTCRTYQLIENPPRDGHGNKPSKTYLGIIVAGAIESELPKDYINSLKAIENNQNLASENMLAKLDQSYERYVD